MNENNDFSFLNNENNEQVNSNPQPVSQDIFNGAPTPITSSESSSVEPSLNNELLSEPQSVIEEPQIMVQQQDEVQTDYTQQSGMPSQPEPVLQSNSSINQPYQENSEIMQPNNNQKKQLNPKFFILVGVIIILIIAGIFILKGCSKGYGKKSSKYPDKFNNTIYYKVSDNEIYEIKYYDDKDAFVAKDSYSKYLNRRVYYPEVYKNVGYFEVDLKFVNKDTLTNECAKASTCDNAYEDYSDVLTGYEGSFISNSDEGINTKKINGKEYKYFIGTIVKNADNTYHYVVYQTKITDNTYYVVTYYGGEDLTEETLKGFLNIKVKKLSSESEIKNKNNLEWY